MANGMRCTMSTHKNRHVAKICHREVYDCCMIHNCSKQPVWHPLWSTTVDNEQIFSKMQTWAKQPQRPTGHHKIHRLSVCDWILFGFTDNFERVLIRPKLMKLTNINSTQHVHDWAVVLCNIHSERWPFLPFLRCSWMSQSHFMSSIFLGSWSCVRACETSKRWDGRLLTFSGCTASAWEGHCGVQVHHMMLIRMSLCVVLQPEIPETEGAWVAGSWLTQHDVVILNGWWAM